MMRDDQVRLQQQCLVDDLGDGIDREEHPPHGRVGVAAGQAHGVPVGCERRRVPAARAGDDVADGEGWPCRSGYPLGRRRPGVGSLPRGPIAQLVERLPYKEDVVGSSPAGPTLRRGEE